MYVCMYVYVRSLLAQVCRSLLTSLVTRGGAGLSIPQLQLKPPAGEQPEGGPPSVGHWRCEQAMAGILDRGSGCPLPEGPDSTGVPRRGEKFTLGSGVQS